MTTLNNTRRGVVRWAVRETMGLVMLALILLLSVGRWNWGMGWALVALTAVWIGATAWVVIPHHPELLAERTGPKQGSKTWDTVILGLMGVNMLIKCIVAGLDVRNGWTTGFPQALQIAALLTAGGGYAIVVWATGANAFFSQLVRIQKERGHTVVTGGPYRWVRHPAYVGTILFELASPLMLGSWWAFIPGGLSALLYVVRTALEDRTLLAELEGYQAYATQTRYRLIPGVW
jgi:protein-S-isoprenylcysteine O-methyltransferase Ste14